MCQCICAYTTFNSNQKAMKTLQLLASIFRGTSSVMLVTAVEPSLVLPLQELLDTLTTKQTILQAFRVKSEHRHKVQAILPTNQASVTLEVGAWTMLCHSPSFMSRARRIHREISNGFLTCSYLRASTGKGFLCELELLRPWESSSSAT